MLDSLFPHGNILVFLFLVTCFILFSVAGHLTRTKTGGVATGLFAVMFAFFGYHFIGMFHF